MTKWGRVDFRELKELKKRLDNLQKGGLDAFCVLCIKDMAARLLGKAKKNTPVVTGTLRRGWAATRPSKQGGTHQIDVINPLMYASYVEYGHRQTPGRFVPAIGKRLKLSWVRGRFMLTRSTAELDSQAQKIIDKKLDQYMEDAINGKGSS